MADSTNNAAPIVVVGIDLGTLSTKITLGPNYDHELVRNAHGGHVTPTAVTFAGKHRARLLGEDAAEVTRADGNTVGMLDRLLVGSLNSDSTQAGDNEDPFGPFRRFQYNNNDNHGGGSVSIPTMEDEYSSTALMAMLLGRIKRNVISTIGRLSESSSSNDNEELALPNLQFVFAVPPSYPECTRNALMDAAHAASIPSSVVLDSTSCMAKVYERRFGDSVVENETKNVMVVDMGHARTCVSILQLGDSIASSSSGEPMEVDAVSSTPEGESAHAEEEKKSNDTMEPSNSTAKSSKVQILSTISSPTLGAGMIEIILYHHFLSTHPSLSHAEFKPNSRAGQRLLEGCRKLKHLLSMLPEGNVMVETIGKNDMDVSLSASRESLRQMCQEGLVEKLTQMVQDAMEGAKEALGENNGISIVELTGGGCRIPMIQDAIRDVMTGRGEEFVFSHSLDDTSLALGAAMVASSTVVPPLEEAAMDPERVNERSRLLANEVDMAQRDTQLVRKDEIRNQIESHILELRSAKHSPHASLLPTSDDFTSYLDGTDDWLFSDECEEATVEKMEEKWANIQSRTHEFCGDYLAAKKTEAEQKDREMEEEAQSAAAERDAEAAINGEDGEDDHDTRRLPTKRRMEIVMKNKAEANELFSGGNYRHAAARYAKALTHCTKFFDLSPQEEQEVKNVKLSLYLNMAFSYIKLEKLDNAFASCNDALSIDPTNGKALYRRATVQYEKRKFDGAMKDLKEAEKLAPEDKAVKKLKLMVEKQMAKQKAKEKAMAKKMFG